MKLSSWSRGGNPLAIAVLVLLGGWLFLAEGCDPEAPYTRLPSGSGGDIGGGGNGAGPGSGGAVMPGTGGSGATGTGGSGATGSGGMLGGTGGAAGGKGGSPSGGTAGQAPATGGVGGGSGGGGGTITSSGGMGGAVTGSGGAAGKPGTGGAGATGGAATGGAGGGGKGGAGGAGGKTPSRIISIDFVGGKVSNGTVTPTPMASTEMAGVKPATHWNEASGASSTATLTPLVQSDGTSLSGSGLTWSSPGNPNNLSNNPGVFSVGLTDAAGDTRMMNGYLDPSSGSTPMATVTVSGLTGTYDVYVYFMASLPSGVTRTHKLAIGSANVTVSQTGPSGTSFPGYTQVTASGGAGNYYVFKQVSGTSFMLTATAATASDSVMRAPVNGIQIVWP